MASGNSGCVSAWPSLPASWVPLDSTVASGSSGCVKDWPALPSSWVPFASTRASGNAGWVKAWPALPDSWVPLASTVASGNSGCVKDWPALPSSCVPLATWWVGSACGTGVGAGCTSFLVPTAMTCDTEFWTTWSSMTSLTSWPLTIDTFVTRRRWPFTPAVTIRVCPSARFVSGLVIVSKGISTKLSSCLTWGFSETGFSSTAGATGVSTTGFSTIVSEATAGLSWTTSVFSFSFKLCFSTGNWGFSAETGLDGWSSASLKYPMYS